jgi:hypothetical protein
MDYFKDVALPWVLLRRARTHPESAVWEQAQLEPLLLTSDGTASSSLTNLSLAARSSAPTSAPWAA